MIDRMEIRGGAGEFEAAVIAVVLDRIERDEKSAAEAVGRRKRGLPAWVRAIRPQEGIELPDELIRPD